MASVLSLGSGGWTRPSPRPAHEGGLASGPGNQRHPGYETSSCRASLKRQFHPFEGAPRASA